MFATAGVMALALAGAPGAGASALVDNGTVQLGVNDDGSLNCQDPSTFDPCPGSTLSQTGDTDYVGLRYLPTGAPSGDSNPEALADGCLCEGWGAADATTGASGYADAALGGPSNLTVVSFSSDGTRAVSVTEVTDPNSKGTSVMRVTHDFHPVSVTPKLYAVTVTIRNLTSAAIDLRYRRAMDWDVEPTAGLEYATIGGAPFRELLYTSDDGFAVPDPLAGPSKIDVDGFFTDIGPDDYGALFDFGFGTLAAGATRTFTIFYGAAPTEPDAATAIRAVGAQTWSFGQPSANASGSPNSGDHGTPNTFIFAFAMPVTLTMSAPRSLPAGGGNFNVTATAKNVGSANVTNVTVGLRLPSGLGLLGPATPASLGTLSPGQQKAQTWRVNAPSRCDDATYPITVTSSYRLSSGATETRQTSSSLFVPGTGCPAAQTTTFGPAPSTATPGSTVVFSPSIAFGDRIVGAPGDTQDATFTNSGPAPVAFGFAVLDGPDAADFRIVSDACSGKTLAPGAKCVITIAFAADRPGVHSATLRIPDDALGSPRVVSLQGVGLAPPEAFVSVNAEPVSGTVLVALPAKAARGRATTPKGVRFIPLAEARTLPIGTRFDTRRGRVRLQTATTARRAATQSGEFFSGLFQTLQRRKERGLTEARLTAPGFKACAASKGKVKARAARKKKVSDRVVRKLGASVKGRFRTSGRYAAATVRGTEWTMTDRCDGTLTRVKRGVVVVRDFRARKNVVVRTGKSYLARARAKARR